MLDVNGIWHDETFNTPGPGNSSGLGGALDLMNVFTAQRMRREQEAQRLAKLMEELQTRPGSDVESLANLPEAQTAYPTQGLSVESMHQMARSDPTYQFQQQMAALPEGATPEQMTGVAARFGTPAGVLSTMGATQRAQARASDARRKAAQNHMFSTYSGERQRGATPEQAADRAVTAMRAFGGLASADEDELIQSFQDAQPELERGLTPKEKADVAKTEAGTELTKAKTTTEDTMRTINAAYKEALTTLAKTREANVGKTPSEKPMTAQAKAAIISKIAKAKTDAQKVRNTMVAANASDAEISDALQPYVDQINDLREQLGQEGKAAIANRPAAARTFVAPAATTATAAGTPIPRATPTPRPDPLGIR